MQAPASLPRRCRGCSRRPAGFTLVEALVGLAIAALVTAGALAVLQSALRVQDWIERHKGAERVQERVLDLLGADLRQVVPSADRGDPLPLQCDSADDGSVHLSMITLSSFALDTSVPAGLYRVTYRYDAEERLLERREVPLRADAEEDLGPVRVIGDLSGLSASFHDSAKWHDRWPPPARDERLPAAMRLVLRFEGPKALEASRTIVLPTE